MATVDMTGSNTPVSLSARNGGPAVMQVWVDLAAAATAKGSALAAADVLQALDIPVGMTVLHAGAEVTTAATGGTAATYDVGETGDPNRWVAAHDASSAGYAASAAASSAVTYAAAGTVDITCGGTTPDTAGVIRVFAVVQECNAADQPQSSFEALGFAN